MKSLLPHSKERMKGLLPSVPLQSKFSLSPNTVLLQSANEGEVMVPVLLKRHYNSDS